MHQDEVSFVFGQPIFMDDGYTNCSVPGWDGYDPGCRGCKYDAKEAEFARGVGRFWTNLAASGDPNKRDAQADAEEVWPAYSMGGWPGGCEKQACRPNLSRPHCRSGCCRLLTAQRALFCS